MEYNADKTTQTVRVIGFGRRFVANLIDIILLLFFIDIILQSIGLLLAVTYFVVLWVTMGQTLGKLAMGIKLISADGSSISWPTAFVRYIGLLISGVVLGLGFFWIAFDRKGQGWHDKIAKTYVVQKDVGFSSTDNITFIPSGSRRSQLTELALTLGVAFSILFAIIAILTMLGPCCGTVFEPPSTPVISD